MGRAFRRAQAEEKKVFAERNLKEGGWSLQLKNLNFKARTFLKLTAYAPESASGRPHF